MATLTDRISDLWEDAQHILTKSVAHILGKAGIIGAKETLAPLVAIGIGGIFADKFAASMLVAGPLSAGFSSALVQGDHLHRRYQILNQYRKEIGAVLGKNPDDVTDADMELVANGDKKRGIKANETIREALDHSAQERNWGVGVSIISSVVSAVALTALMTMPGSPMYHGESHAVFGTMAHLVETVTNGLIGGAVSLGIYLPISAGLHALAENVFGLERETVNDRVKNISRTHARGRTVTQEQVFETFIEAHPQLDDMIKKGFGRRFERLKPEQKEDVLATLGPQLDIPRMTADINSGAMRPEELAFAVQGQFSGVRLDKVAEKPAPAAAAHVHEPEVEQTISHVERLGRPAHARAGSFVQLVGGARPDNGFAESLEARAQAEVQLS